MVAAVYYNRLQRNMALAADPSVIYAALLAGRYRGTIYQSDLQYDSPYNTYRYPGLPPGPIANPGLASLQAAMHPGASRFPVLRERQQWPSPLCPQYGGASPQRGCLLPMVAASQ